ncbi:MAG: ABC transporter ATP-binding protein, partial [Rhodomicrobium sp.]
MVLTREISRDPGLIVALYPTRGLDVQSANAVRDALIEMRNKGAAILVVSEELEELFMLSDRLAVLTEGRLVAEFEPSQYNAETVGSWMVRALEMPSAA